MRWCIGMKRSSQRLATVISVRFIAHTMCFLHLMQSTEGGMPTNAATPNRNPAPRFFVEAIGAPTNGLRTRITFGWRSFWGGVPHDTNVCSVQVVYDDDQPIMLAKLENGAGVSMTLRNEDGQIVPMTRAGMAACKHLPKHVKTETQRFSWHRMTWRYVSMKVSFSKGSFMERLRFDPCLFFRLETPGIYELTVDQSVVLVRRDGTTKVCQLPRTSLVFEIANLTVPVTSTSSQIAYGIVTIGILLAVELLVRRRRRTSRRENPFPRSGPTPCNRFATRPS
jgi:hypothetical protein